MTFARSGALFVSALYLQGVLHCSPWQTGLRTLPLPAGLALPVGRSVENRARSPSTRVPTRDRDRPGARVAPCNQF
ncbi:hypothetical protein [Streptomyces sp. NPDC051677]|uniref:hypothetical protein n=1 Tax=Streptomyces sp. NPDC051677 TaxID=3365669 RepID=UPI0037D4B55A